MIRPTLLQITYPSPSTNLKLLKATALYASHASIVQTRNLKMDHIKGVRLFYPLVPYSVHPVS